MFYSVLSNEVSTTIKCVKYLKNLQNTNKIKSLCPATWTVGKLKEFKHSLEFNNNFLIKNSLLPLSIGQIKLKAMEDIIELADLATEQESSVEKEKFDIDFDMKFSESENSSMEEELDDSIPVEKVPYKENYYQHSFSINRNCYKQIVGFKGLNLRRLCTETKTVIRVSKKKKSVGSVQKRIIRAKHQIAKLIEDSKKEKLRFTHFISIPTNSNEIKDEFSKFKMNILRECNLESTGFHRDMFQRPEKLHLTICMLHLLDDSDQEKAVEALNQCKKDIIDPVMRKNGPLKIEFKSLTYMGSNASKARVVYFKVYEKTGSLQKISEDISDYFVKQGLSRKERDNLTLHLTVMNTFYLKRKKHQKPVKTFDATDIIKNHEETSLGEITLSTLHLSKLTAKSADGYFEAASKIVF